MPGSRGCCTTFGYWVLVQECPDALARALQLSQSENLPLFECERRATGATHAEIGAYLLGLWGLPYSIVEAVACTTPRPASPHTAMTCWAH